MKLCREKVRKVRTQTYLAGAVKGNEKYFYKYMSNKRSKENLCPLLDVVGNILTRTRKRLKYWNAYFAPDFNSKSSCPQGMQQLEMEEGDGEQN